MDIYPQTTENWEDRERPRKEVTLHKKWLATWVIFLQWLYPHSYLKSPDLSFLISTFPIFKVKLLISLLILALLWMLGKSWWVGTSLVFTSFIDSVLPPLWAFSDSPGRVCPFPPVLISLCAELGVWWLVHMCSRAENLANRRFSINVCFLLISSRGKWMMKEWALSSAAVVFLSQFLLPWGPPTFAASMITLAQHSQRTALSHVLQWGFVWKS